MTGGQHVKVRPSDRTHQLVVLWVLSPMWSL